MAGPKGQELYVVTKADTSKRSESRTAKRPYRKPNCEIVKLVADEVLATGCKFIGTTGAGGLENCGLLNIQCSLEGS